MDPLTLAVSVGGLISLAKDVYDIVWVGYLAEAIDAPGEIHDFHTKLGALRDVLSSFKELLEDDVEGIGLKFAQGSGLEIAKKDCEYALLDLKRRLPKAKKSKPNLRQRLVWPFKSDDVRKTCRKLDEYCHIFQFCLSIEHCKVMARSSHVTIEELAQIRTQLHDLDEGQDDVLEQIGATLDLLRSCNEEMADISKGVSALMTEADQNRLNRILNWISPPGDDQTSKHVDTRSKHLPGTCTELLNSDTLMQWKSSADGSQYLCYHGDPGAGKSVFCGAIIDTLSETSAVSFYYFDWQAQKRPYAVFRILLRQAVQRVSRMDISSQLLSLYEASGNNDFSSAVRDLKDIINLLRIVAENQQKIFICLDALDECNDTDRHELLEALAQLPSKFKLLMTARKSVDLRPYFAGLQHIEVSASQIDVEAYVRHRIDQDKKRHPQRMNDELEVAIVHKLAAQSAGLFLLPSLQLSNILAKNTAAKRRKALDSSSTSLAEAYDQTLHRIRNQESENQGLEIIAWVFFAQRPLTMLELRHALSIELDYDCPDPEFDPDNVPDASCISDCLGLVILDPDSELLRFMHLSFLDYLDSSCSQIAIEFISPMREILAEKCVTYALYKQIRAPVTTQAVAGLDRHRLRFQLKSDFPTMQSSEPWDTISDMDAEVFLAYVALHWGEHVNACQPFNSDSVFGRKIEQLLNLPEAETHRLSGWWHDLMLRGLDDDLDPPKGPMGAEFLIVLRDPDGQSEAETAPGESSYQVSPVHQMIVYFGLGQLWEGLRNGGTKSLADQEADYFCWAEFDLEFEVAWPAGYLENIRYRSNTYPMDLLGYAVLGGRPEMVDRILSRHQKTTHAANPSLTRIQWLTYALGCRDACARRILAASDAQQGLAVAWGFIMFRSDWRLTQREIWKHPDEELLLELVNHPGFPGEDASLLLCYAARCGFPRLASRLLQFEGVDVNFDGCTTSALMGPSPIGIALEWGQEEDDTQNVGQEAVAIVLLKDDRLFLSLEDDYSIDSHENSFESSTLPGDLRTRQAHELLVSGAGNGWKAFTDFLLQQYPEIDINACSRSRYSPEEVGALHEAVDHERLGMTRHLLAHPQIDPNLYDSEMRTPLHIAIAQSRDSWGRPDNAAEFVQALLAHPRIDPNRCDAKGNTPLHVAAACGRLACVRLLLEHHLIDSTLLSTFGDTAYDLAVLQGERELEGQQRDELEAIKALLRTAVPAKPRQQGEVPAESQHETTSSPARTL